MNTEAKVYPTTPDTDGFYLESLQDEFMNVHTKKYDNGSVVKKVLLRNGRIAIVREMERTEMKRVHSLAGDTSTDNDRYTAALIAVCTKIDDQEIIMEDVLEYKAKDFSRLTYASQTLNF